MFLTHEQLVELTHYRQHSKQREAFARMGVPYRQRPDGSNAVAASVFDAGEQRATIRPSPAMRLPNGTPKKA